MVSLFIRFFSVAFAMMLFSCNATKPIVNPEERTAFYTIEAKKDSAKNETYFSVKDVQIANSKMHRKPNDDQSKNAYHLEIEIFDNSKNTVIVYTEHPLYKRFDLYEESGEIESKSISLQQGDVTFRAPFFTDYKKIKITETVNFKKLTPTIIKNEK